MFTRIQTLGFKCLRYTDVALNPFGVLVGPNGSGKSALIDVFAFLQDALLSDIASAVHKRGSDLREMTWNHKTPPGFEFALEALAQADERSSGLQNAQRRLRYELSINLNEQGEIAVADERLWSTRAKAALPSASSIPSTLMTKQAPREWRIVLRRESGKASTYYRSERTNWHLTIRHSQRKLGLSAVPEDEARFGAALWLHRTLSRSVQVIQLNGARMRQPCPADAPRTFCPDGSNLPVMVRLLKERGGKQFETWLAHVRDAIPDLESVEVAERPEDRACYLCIRYRNGAVVPSWLISDGTLRLMALTLIAYLPVEGQVFIIEEPENGVHPKALASVFKSLSSVRGSQVLVSTYSPVLLELARTEDLLFFSRSSDGSSTIVQGEEGFGLKDKRFWIGLINPLPQRRQPPLLQRSQRAR